MEIRKQQKLSFFCSITKKMFFISCNSCNSWQILFCVSVPLW